MNILHNFTPRVTLLPFHRPSITEGDRQAVARVLDSQWLTTGPEAAAFEREFAAYVGASHAVAVSSCTAGLHLVLRGLGIGSGVPVGEDEVIVPTMTFTATASEVLHAGGRVVLADIDPLTFNLSAGGVAEVARPSVRGVVFVHLAGNPSRLDVTRDWADQHELFVLEDAAHALPAMLHTRRVGSISDATVFSFYATKPLCASEGGMITTEDSVLAERVRTMSCHGVDRDTYRRSRTALAHYDVVEGGYKANLPDLLAALGRSQLARQDVLWARRTRIAGAYVKALGDDPAVARFQYVEPDVISAWHLFLVVLNLDALTISRDRFAEELRALNIATSLHYRPLHRHTYWAELLRDGTRVRGPKSFPHADWLYERLLSLPIFPDMTDEDVEDVIRTVQYVSRRFRR